jgi:translation initiation factor 3 subunit B
MPQDASGETLGFAFLEFGSKQNANDAAVLGDGHEFDKKHTLRTNKMSDFDRIVRTPDQWERPSDREFDEKENLHSWLLNPDCDDQFVLRHAGMTSVFWNKRSDRSICMERENFTDTTVEFSPRGSYMATYHEQGTLLWGNKKFDKLGRFGHKFVKSVSFSPCERFVVTAVDLHKCGSDPSAIIVWDIKSGDKKRSFPIAAPAEPGRPVPPFLWSHDGNYFGRIEQGMIHIYATSDFNRLAPIGSASAEIKEFAWSPTNP